VSESEGLLDRADALVWALTALMLGPPPSEGPRIRGFDLAPFPRGLSG
jgi:phage terminase large subunit-like protein